MEDPAFFIWFTSRYPNITITDSKYALENEIDKSVVPYVDQSKANIKQEMDFKDVKELTKTILSSTIFIQT